MAIKQKKLTSGLVLTWKCNLKCIHCYPYLPKNNESSSKKLKSRIIQLKKEGYLFLNITGGEPLLREDFFDIIRYVKEKGFAILISTNGTLLTKEIARKLKNLNILQLQISLFGSNKSTHERITKVKGSFEKTVAAANFLKQQGLRVIFKTTAMKENISEVYKITALAKKMNIEHTISPLKPC